MAWKKKYREQLSEYRKEVYNDNEVAAAKVEKMHQENKLSARERLSCLFDNGKYYEMDTYAESSCNDFDMDKKKRPGDGIVTCWGYINGKVVYAASQDITSMGGSLGKVHGDKICRIQDLAYENKAPIVFLIDSGGARVEEGVDALAGYSGIFLRNTKCSGVIPQISILLGYSVGGSSYLPAMCDFTIMTAGTSKMFITGPGVVKEVLGEDVTAEELGGHKIHSEESGAVDFVCEDDESALMKARQLLEYVSVAKVEETAGTDKKCDSIEEIVPDNQRQVYDVKKVIRTIVDDHTFLEVKKKYARNVVVGFSRLGGRTIGVVANQPLQLGGSLDVKSAEKVARFVRFCDCFDIPLLTLVDTPGFLPGRQQEADGIIRRGAKMLYAYSEATVPKVTLVMRKAYGGAYIAMNSKEMGADLVYAWPIAQLAVLGAEGAVNVVFRKEIKRAENPEAARKNYIQEFQDKFMNPYMAAKQGYVDDVILPEETRTVILDAFRVLGNKQRVVDTNKKHGNISL